MKYAEAVRKAKHDYLSELLVKHGKNISKAALVAGVNRTSLYKLAEKYNVKLPRRLHRGKWDREIPSHW